MASPEKNKERIRRWRKANPDKCREYSKKWRINNPDKDREINRRYKTSEKGKQSTRRRRATVEGKAKRKAERKRYWRSEKGKAARNRYDKRRRAADPGYRVKRNLRARLYLALKNNQKAGSAVRDLGCSVGELRLYLENYFPLYLGMSWNNYGLEWEIDHIIALSKFDLTDREQFLEACHYTNLQPLWVSDNRRKSGGCLGVS